jgi:hypothetical protein
LIDGGDVSESASLVEVSVTNWRSRKNRIENLINLYIPHKEFSFLKNEQKINIKIKTLPSESHLLYRNFAFFLLALPAAVISRTN